MSTLPARIATNLGVLGEGAPRDAERSALAAVVCAKAEGLVVRRAQEFLTERGYDTEPLVALAATLLPVVQGAELDRPYEPAEADTFRAPDDVDRVLDCLAAGMSAPEIAAAMAGGVWPDPAALTLMTGLRTT